MSEKKEKLEREGFEESRESRNGLFRELESRVISLVSTDGNTLSKKKTDEIRSLIDQYFERWKK